MFRKEISITVFILFLAPLYIVAAGDSAVALIRCSALSPADFAASCKAQKYDSAEIAFYFMKGLYLPEDQKSVSDIAVYPALKYSYGQLKKSLQQNSTFEALISYTTTLYKLIGEPMKIGQTSRDCKRIDYLNHALACKSVFDSLSTGAWAFDCGGHAAMAKIFLDSLGKGKYISKNGQLNRKVGDEVDHNLTLVYYKENNQWYGVTVDCQNGKLGPVRAGTGSILTIAEQKTALALKQNDSLQIMSIPENDLHQKRNLMNSAFNCNVLPDDSCMYHLSNPLSGYKYERLTYSAIHYIWFKAGRLNLNNYKQNLLALLIKNAPKN
jgi:hypothetical protein